MTDDNDGAPMGNVIIVPIGIVETVVLFGIAMSRTPRRTVETRLDVHGSTSCFVAHGINRAGKGRRPDGLPLECRCSPAGCRFARFQKFSMPLIFGNPFRVLDRHMVERRYVQRVIGSEVVGVDDGVGPGLVAYDW